MAANQHERPVSIVIAAMGGEGGGVLTTWLVSAARKANLPVQATSVPGVAQRTGATTYYVEIVPKTYEELGDREPVMDLYPGPGDIDLMISTELLETGRALEKGFISPVRTTLIGSTHRVYTLAEKMAMGDARYDGDKILEAARQMAKRAILFDIERAARDTGSIMNAVILGAIAASDLMPISAEDFEQGIKDEGKAVESNLAGFRAGLAYARGEIVEMHPKPGAGRSTFRPEKSTEEFKARIERDYPATVHPVVMEGCGRVFDFQDAKYARLYLDRLDTIRAIDEGRGADGPAGGDFKLTNEVGRHLALRMTFEDIMRVAQLKTRASRFERVRGEVEAKPDQLVRVTEHFKPGPYELASVLPRGLGRRVAGWADKNPSKARKWHFGMHIRTDTVWGYTRVRMMAGMRKLRRIGYRYAEEQDLIEEWLDLVRDAAGIDRDFALEVAECARLIKGYSDTHKRGVGNYRKIVDSLIRPAIAAGKPVPAEVAKVRTAALADPEGESLSQALASLAEPDKPVSKSGASTQTKGEAAGDITAAAE